MSRRRRRSRRASSVSIRHGIGLVLLAVVLLFLLQLGITFVREGNWRGALVAGAVAAGLVVITFFSGRKS